MNTTSVVLSPPQPFSVPETYEKSLLCARRRPPPTVRLEDPGFVPPWPGPDSVPPDDHPPGEKCNERSYWRRTGHESALRKVKINPRFVRTSELHNLTFETLLTLKIKNQETVLGFHVLRCNRV